MDSQATQQFMLVDSSAVKALGLLPESSAVGKYDTLFGLLNNCCTKNLGSLKLKQWILHPLLSPLDIRARQNLVSCFFDNSEVLETVRKYLKKIPDVCALSNKIGRGKASLEDAYKLYQIGDVLKSIQNSIEFALLQQNENSQHLSAFEEVVSKLKSFLTAERFGKFSDLVETAIDLEVVPSDFLIRVEHDTSGTLGTLKAELESIQESVLREQNEIMENELDGMNAKFEEDKKFIKTYGFHFRVAKKFDRELKRLGDTKYKYLTVVNSAIRWSSRSLLRYSEEYEAKRERFEEHQSILVNDFMGVCNSFIPLFEELAEFVAELDVLQSFAHVALYSPIPYERPAILEKNGERSIKIKGGRHPCVESQPGISEFIPNDYEFVEGGFQILTGPNMAGKSTYIRQLGILCIMAQIGSFVPADSMETCILDAVLCRIGADDSQFEGVSTFMAEMKETSVLINQATKNSLVIVDELGRGTSTYEGLGIAYGISKYILEDIQCFGIFATHFHELADIQGDLESTGAVKKGRIVNKYVDAMVLEDRLVFLYKVKEGVSKKSFGINIAKLTGFPTEAVKFAEKVLETFETGYILDKSSTSEKLRNKMLDRARAFPLEACKDQEKVREFLLSLKNDFAPMSC